MPLAGKRRDCWFNYDGFQLVQFSAVIGSALVNQADFNFREALATAGERDPFFGTLVLINGNLTHVLSYKFSHRHEHIDEVLKALLDQGAFEDLYRLDLIHQLSFRGDEPSYIVQMDFRFGYPQGHA